MKRNFHFTLIVLFIFSACQPGSSGQGQAATATQEQTSDFQNSPALISPISTTEPITIKDYPTNAYRFIIDTRTDEQKMHLVNSWAPMMLKKKSIYTTKNLKEWE